MNHQNIPNLAAYPMLNKVSIIIIKLFNFFINFEMTIYIDASLQTKQQIYIQFTNHTLSDITCKCSNSLTVLKYFRL